MMDLPKANCHVHANGMATDTDIRRLARKYDIDLSTFSHIRPDGRRIWSDGHHSASHEAYDQSVSLIRAPEDLHDIVKRALVRESGQGSVYTRILSSGLNNCRNGAVIETFERYMKAIAAAINDARAETGMESFISVSAKRHLKNGPNQAHRLLDAYEAFRKAHPDEAALITGFDMAGNEEHANCGHFKEVFARAAGLGLGCSSHCGEVQPAHDVRAALELPGIRQISHALSAIKDPALMRRLKERGTFVDQLLVSNEQLHDYSPENHPIRRYVEEGLYLGLGSDDPGLQGSGIADEYRKAHQDYGLLPEQLLEFTANSIRFAFAPLAVKERLLRRVARRAREQGLVLRPETLSLPQSDKNRPEAQL